MREFRQLEDYQLFYEEVSVKKQTKSKAQSDEATARASKRGLTEKQISLLSQDLQHPLAADSKQSNPLK